MNPETYEYEENIIGKSPIPPLTESNLKDKRMYESRRFDSLYAKIEACRGIRPAKNYVHFALNWGDPDIGYGSYVND